MGGVRLTLRTETAEDYETFLRLRRLPQYRVRGDFAEVPAEYAHLFGGEAGKAQSDYRPSPFLFDYQRDIAVLAIRKRKFAVFADCGLGKTLILLEFARHAFTQGHKTLIVSPLMVVPQTAAEASRWYGFGPTQIPAADLQRWLDDPADLFGITNYDAIRDGVTRGRLGCLILDESSMLKSHYGKWGSRLVELGRGLPYKLCLTGTPAPNDRIEYANHSVLLDVHRTTNEFLATYFVNRGETQNRWEIKPHALRPFYRDLSHWCIFLSDPAVYGWRDNAEPLPPIHVHIEDVPLSDEQRRAVRELTGTLVVKDAGGITQRGKLSQIGKGQWKGRPVTTEKPAYIKRMVESWPDESTIIWCRFNDEQAALADLFPDAANIAGETPQGERLRLIDDFKAGRRRVLVSKPRILGFGLNLQVATRQVFSALDDSYEEFYQAVKRSNRYGSTKPLNVHVPVTEIEEPMVRNVLRKAARVEADTREQEQLFRETGYAFA